jgi:carboxyl-terminal processing protease
VALLPATTAGLAAVDARSGPQFGKLVAIYQLVKANYVDKVDDDKLIKGAIEGMLESLDPHSSYLDGASLQRLETMIDGNYSGLGLSVVMDDGAVKVVSPFRGSPAERRASRRATISPTSTASSITAAIWTKPSPRCAAPAGTSIRLTIFRPAATSRST